MYSGPAAHLSNLVPSNACLHRPSLSIIYEFLSGIQIPVETIALASCILDALSSKFARRWRQRILRASRLALSSSLKAEVIVVSAVALAHAYCDDRHSSTLFWSQQIPRVALSVEGINATSVCIMEDIDYSLERVARPEMIERAIEDMREAGRNLDSLRRMGGFTDGAVDMDDEEIASNDEDARGVKYWSGLPTP